MSFNIDDYVDVAERISQFYERYPDGRLCTGSPPHVVSVGGKDFVWFHARAHRFPDDPLPGDGWAAEPVPGPSQFTRDSELMNAETAAWGRAIVSLGFGTKKIASKQEVKARTDAPLLANVVQDAKPGGPNDPKAPMSASKRAEVEAFAEKAGFDFWEVADELFASEEDGFDAKITNAEAREVCEEIARRKKTK